MNIIEYYMQAGISTTGKVYIGLFIAAVCLAIGFKIYANIVDKKDK